MFDSKDLREAGAWISNNKLTSVGSLWLTLMAGNIAYQFTRPVPLQLKIIHSRVYSQFVTIGAVAVSGLAWRGVFTPLARSSCAPSLTLPPASGGLADGRLPSSLGRRKSLSLLAAGGGPSLSPPLPSFGASVADFESRSDNTSADWGVALALSFLRPSCQAIGLAEALDPSLKKRRDF